ncbi:hypothetical protein [Sphingomonas sp.]|uniref:hypothetical protein n=1 Tax=Sphingomonas sp. TaxID=28214 RepID=UPI0038AE5705
MKKLIVAIALGAAVIGTPAVAQAPGGGGWQQRDQTRAEAQQRADTMFQMLDANKDGNVTKAEAEQLAASRDETRGAGRLQRMIDQAFGTAQSLTQAQFEALALTRFDAQDLNHDGTVTAAERGQMRAQQQGQIVPNSQPKAQ